MGTVHVLVIEDNDDDALLLVTQLRRAGVELTYQRVQTAAEVSAALRTRAPDIVICDYQLPSFSAPHALELLREHRVDAPFIVVSGAVGEEIAAAVMKAGAHDVILKDRLSRLAPAVRRELADAQVRQQRRNAEAALRASEERFRLLAEHIRDIVFRYRLKPEPVLEYVSPAAADLTGYPTETLYANPPLLFEMVVPEDRGALEPSWHAADPAPVVLRCQPRTGDPLWIELRAIGVPDDAGAVVAVEGILRDVTAQVLADQERERLDHELRQTERLDSLGRLSGGVAHDFNNLLAVIMTYASEIADTLPAGDPVRADAEKISLAAERGAALTRQLLIFSRLEPTHPEVLNLNAIITDLEQLLRPTIGEDVEFLTSLEDGLRPITIDRSKLEQVIMNLVVNARAAMPQGGRLSIQTASIAGKPGGQVCLTVTDTGCGMSPEVAQRAFEPFFTTKEPGQGTGLGLATAYGVVKEAGGDITLSSSPGAGTTIRVFFPNTASGETAAPEPAPAAPHGAGQAILVVEDDAAVRGAVSSLLARANYTVISAATPKEALEICTNPLVHIDALLSDVVMPEMSGFRLVDRVKEVRPDLPILLMSGYTAGWIPGEPASLPGVPLIRKPFNAATLLQQLGSLLP
ncbi:MAG TPA: response regulator [Rugosimonospora sp.]|nr:response regulator [Rugosimonospora sp.]